MDARGRQSAQLPTVPSTRASTVFVDYWVIPYGIPTDHLTDNGLQFVSKFFAVVTVLLGIEHVMTTASCPRPAPKWQCSAKHSSPASDTMVQISRLAGISICNRSHTHLMCRYTDWQTQSHSACSFFVSHSPRPLEARPAQCQMKWRNCNCCKVSAVDLYAAAGRPMQANGGKHSDWLRTILVKLRQNSPTHAKFLPYITCLCWQTTDPSEYISTHADRAITEISAEGRP